MPRYIDADALISKVCGYYCGCERTECGMEEINEPCKRVSFIEDAPTVSPDEVRGVGKWEMWEDYCGSNVYKCSVCGSDWDMIEGTPQDNDFKYCPNCGARMGGVQDALS